MYSTSELFCDTAFVQPREKDWFLSYVDDPRELFSVLCSERALARETRDRAEAPYPVMRVAWPVPNLRGGPEEDGDAVLACGAVCLMEDTEEDNLYIALTGGGMDLSWDLAAAYVALGYVPPLALCTLPRYAGMTLGRKQRRVLAACRKTLQVVRSSVKHTAYGLRCTAAALAEETARRRAQE